MNTPQSPLWGPSPAEVPLAAPPLVQVIAQVRFPVIASVETDGFIAPFQEAVRAEYPVLQLEEERRVQYVDGAYTGLTKTWRFRDVDGAFQLTLTSSFLALETGRYTSRDDFLARLRGALLALREHVAPERIDRLGIRYIDRVTGENLNDLSELVRPEVCGVLSTSLSGHLRHVVSEHLFALPNAAAFLMARWGLVPGGSIVDPAVEPVDEPSWLLDLDAFQGQTQALDVDTVVSQTRGLAERIYSLFRWVVTDEFLRRYGGQP